MPKLLNKITLILFLLFTQTGIGGLNAQTIISGETINKKDTNGLKTGYWEITGAMQKDKSYTDSLIVEKGNYAKNRKVGQWVKYYPNGKKKSEIDYVNGRPKGHYITYFDNGNIEEEGDWVRQKNTGNFKRYFKSGKIMQDFHFDEKGVRQGQQKYFYENGNLEVEVTIIDGKEEGAIKRYYSNGELKSELNTADGKAIDNSFVSYKPKQKEVPVKRTPVIEKKVARVEPKAKPNLGKINPEGYNKLYTRSLLLLWDGDYHKGKPWTGKKYVYNSNGILVNIEIYKKGFFIGNGIIEEGQ